VLVNVAGTSAKNERRYNATAAEKDAHTHTMPAMQTYLHLIVLQSSQPTHTENRILPASRRYSTAVKAILRKSIVLLRT